MDDDEWVASHFPNDRLRLHALGLLNIYWNQCENGLFWIFVTVSKLPETEAWALVHDLGDVAISQRISTLMDIKAIDAPLKSAVANAIAIYDICRQNRNQLTHFQVVEWTDDFQLARRSKKPDSRDVKFFPSSLPDVRRVVEDIKALEQQLWILAAMMGDFDPAKPGPWPPILPEPELLWKPPQPVRPKRPTPP